MLTIADLKKLSPAETDESLRDVFPYDRGMTDAEFHQALQDFLFPLAFLSADIGLLKTTRADGQGKPTLFARWSNHMAHLAVTTAYEGVAEDTSIFDKSVDVAYRANEAAHRLFGPTSNVHLIEHEAVEKPKG